MQHTLFLGELRWRATELHADSTLYSSPWAWLIVLESRTMSPAKSVSLRTFAGCLLLCRGPNINPGAVSSSPMTIIIYTDTSITFTGML